MICSSSSPPIRRRPGAGRGPRGFTMVELLAVILILAVLIALFLPALNGALKTAKNAAVGGEINQLAQALASFKAQYGDYPPSRIYLAEDGDFGQAASTQIAPGNITYAQLAQRSASILRKFFPRVVINTTNNVVWPHNQTNRWYDFNGNGSFDYTTPYILQGHECLVFFLGGIVLSDSFPNPITVSSNLGMTGFGKDPTNPFSNNIASDPNYQNNPNPMYSNNRQAPFFEFAGSRLWLDPHGTSGMPGYLDSLGNATPTGNPGDPINFYAYFSSYGNGGYDPNDVNFFTELDVNLSSAELIYHVAFPTGANGCYSPCAEPLHQHDIGAANKHDPSSATSDDLPESSNVPDHLVGDRRAIRRGRAVHSQRHGGGPAAGPELKLPGGDLPAICQHDGCDDSHSRAGQHHQLP